MSTTMNGKREDVHTIVTFHGPRRPSKAERSTHYTIGRLLLPPAELRGALSPGRPDVLITAPRLALSPRMYWLNPQRRILCKACQRTLHSEGNSTHVICEITCSSDKRASGAAAALARTDADERKTH